MKDLKIQGFLHGEEQYKRNFPETFDGKRLDEIQLSATIESLEDANKLIKFLQINKYCFYKKTESENIQS